MTVPEWAPGARQYLSSIPAVESAMAEFTLAKAQGADDRTAVALALERVGFDLCFPAADTTKPATKRRPCPVCSSTTYAHSGWRDKKLVGCSDCPAGKVSE